MCWRPWPTPGTTACAVGPEHDALCEYYGRELQPRRLTIEFAVQQEPKGTADVAAELLVMTP